LWESRNAILGRPVVNPKGIRLGPEEPLEQLITRIPELKGICPAANREALAMILRKTGGGVDEFFDNVVGPVAQEQIKQERVGGVGGSRSVRDSYLILRHGNSTRADFDEFRMDANGNRLDQFNFTDGFLVTSGFGLMCMHFSTALQWNSRFLYPWRPKGWRARYTRCGICPVTR
jgi:hypothetical protein